MCKKKCANYDIFKRPWPNELKYTKKFAKTKCVYMANWKYTKNFANFFCKNCAICFLLLKPRRQTASDKHGNFGFTFHYNYAYNPFN